MPIVGYAYCIANRVKSNQYKGEWENTSVDKFPLAVMNGEKEKLQKG